jgi:hypothetical protein
MGDNDKGVAAAATAAMEVTFSINMYVLLISFFALVVGLYTDQLGVHIVLYKVRSTSAFVMLISVNNLTWKLLNNPTRGS